MSELGTSHDGLGHGRGVAPINTSLGHSFSTRLRAVTSAFLSGCGEQDMGSLVTPLAKKVYQGTLRFARESGTREAVSNRYPWHCRYAIRELLEHGESLQFISNQGNSPQPSICVLTGALPEFVYDEEVFERLKKFIDNGGRVRIIIWSESPTEEFALINPILALAKKYPPAEGEQGSLEVRFSGSTLHGDKLSHFFLIGKSAYRYELPHEIFTSATKFSELKPEIPAKICFNDLRGGEKLFGYFTELWGSIGNRQAVAAQHKV